MKLINIKGEYEYQGYPLEVNAIEIDIDVLNRIGIDKKFDIANSIVVDMTADEINSVKTISDNSIANNKITFEIDNLKNQLASTDYKAIKYIDRLINEEEYSLIKKERQDIRDKIKLLEKTIIQL